MRADLLEAQACIDWTVSQLPSFDARITAWLRNNMHAVIEYAPPPATKDFVIAIEKELFPLTFSVECGAYINTIRSSLDILAIALAKRHNITSLKQIYFPIAIDETSFSTGRYKGKDLIYGLPQAERTLIENLKPYKGGNHLLWFLHKLDIERKHHKLLGVAMHTTSMSIPPEFLADDFTPTFQAWTFANQKTVLGLLKKGSGWDGNKIQVAPVVTLNEPGILQYQSVIESLNNFARLAHSIIELFDA